MQTNNDLPQQPLVSIVVPTCGRVPLFYETLSALGSQTYRSIQVIVTDDSADENDRRLISEAVRSFADRTGFQAEYLFTKPRLYQAANTNQGLRHAQGDLVRILHSDDLLRPDAIEQEVAVFARFPGTELLFEDCVPFASTIEWTSEVPNCTFVSPAQHLRTELSHSTALPSGMVFRRSTLQRAGFMDEKLDFLCDWEFFFRLLLDQIEKGRLVCRMSPGLFGWRTHANSVSGRLWKVHFEEHAQFMDAVARDPRLKQLNVFSDSELKQFIRTAEKYRYRRLASDFKQLSSAERRKSAVWFAEKQLNPVGRTMLRRQVGREITRFVRRIKSKLKKPAASTQPAAAPPPPPDIFRTTTLNRGSTAILPFYDERVMKTHDTSLVLDFDNSLNLWPYRDRIRNVGRIRLFHLNTNRMYERTLHEVLKYVSVGNEVEIVIEGNHHLQWFGLKAAIELYFPRQFSVTEQQQFDGGMTRVVFRREKAVAEHLAGEHTGWTFGLLTLGKDLTRTERYIKSIEACAPSAYEVIVVTPRQLSEFSARPNVRQIIFNQRDEVGWITRKKNLICEASQYSDILICHDRYELTRDFFTDSERFGYSYGMAGPRVLLQDGRRGLDWAVASSQNHTWSHGGLLDYRAYSRYVYVPGGSTIVRKGFWQQYPWDEKLYWNEHEDVELCRRAQRGGEVIALSAASLITASDRWIDENPLLSFNAEREQLFGHPVGEQVLDFSPLRSNTAA